MPPMRAARLAFAAACLLASAALLAACGGDGETTDSNGGGGGQAESRPAPPSSAFPSSAGRSLEEVLKLADAPSELVFSPLAMAFYPGENRYPLGVFERDGDEVVDGELALYFAKVPRLRPGAKSKPGSKGPAAKAEAQALDAPAIGPFPAKIESLAAAPRFRAETPPEYPQPASVVYSAEVDLPSDGEWRVAALIENDGELESKLLSGAVVGEFAAVPRPGQKAPRIHTPTAEDVAGDLSKITTRVPPDTQNEVDYADALGKEPIVLLFATPKFCQSRVCGPVVDATEEAKRKHGDEAAFIHMEIYNDNDPSQNVRPQVRAFSLPTEPWLFTIDRRGVVKAAIEGAFGAELLDEAIESAVR
jgi:hypothetical protein